MRRIAANFAAILLFAVALFFLGPEYGSLDIDGDGIPDVPVMVTQESTCPKVQAPESNGQTKVGLATARLFLGLSGKDPVPLKEGVAIKSCSSRLTTVLPLRC